ncbi:zinc-binding dehydrogenase [Paraburkholderia sp. RAU2J]|uniref:zinc-binding dehydrogenase n=1 Tax=Paraburkholderia sp. RAU2J TaxID=1938810 RepID=UPI00321FAE42
MQFAKNRCAEVFVTASGDGVEFVRALGADHVIAYWQQRFEDLARDMDLVFDLVGGETQQRSWAVVKSGGALISTLNEPSQIEATNHGARATRYTARSDAKQRSEIGRLIDEGEVVVKVTATYPFAATPNALVTLEKGHVRGKIVVDMAQKAEASIMACATTR